MKNNMAISKDQLMKLYETGSSMKQISMVLHCSIHKVEYWMGKYHVRRRNLSDAAYLQQNPFGDPFLIKPRRTKKDHMLYGLGLGLYWGEGNKVSKHSVRITNSDPKVIRMFA